MKTNKAKTNWIAEAVDNWPEDEAYGLFRVYQERLLHDCDKSEDREYEQIAFTRLCERMRSIIDRDSEGDASLVLRFNAKLNELMTKENA